MSCPTASNNSAPNPKHSSPAGRNSATGSPSACPNHIGQSCGSRSISARACNLPTSSLPYVVVMVNVGVNRTAQAVRTLAIAQREPSVTINHARFLDYRPLVERRPRENSVPKTAYATNLPPPGCAS